MIHRALACVALAALVATGCNSDKSTGNGQPADIVVTPAFLSVRQHETGRILASVVDAGGRVLSGVAVTFESSDPAIVTVSNTGVVTSVGPAGTATISVRTGDLTKTVPVSITGIPTSISVTPNTLTLPQTAKVQLEAKLLDLDGGVIEGATFTYASSNVFVANVSTSGLVTSVGRAGTAVITVVSGEVAKGVPLTVTVVPTTLTLGSPTLRVGRNTSVPLRPVALDTVGQAILNPAISYTSSAPEIVSVSADGILTTSAATGSSTITATFDRLTATVAVNVAEIAHPGGTVVSSSRASGYGGAITSSGDFYVTGSDTASRGKLPNYTSLTPVTGVPGGLAVVTNRAGNAVFFAAGDGAAAYDPVQDQVRWRVTGLGPPLDVVLSNDESTVFLASGPVEAIDATTGAVKWTLALGDIAVHLAVSPTRNVLYASSPFASAVYEIDLTTRDFVVIPMPGRGTQDLVVSPDGSELYVALESGGLAFINTATHAATVLDTPGCNGYGLLMTPDAEQLWIGCSSNASIMVVNRQTRTILQTMEVRAVRRLAASPDGTVVIASSESSITFIR